MRGRSIRDGGRGGKERETDRVEGQSFAGGWEGRLAKDGELDVVCSSRVGAKRGAADQQKEKEHRVILYSDRHVGSERRQ